MPFSVSSPPSIPTSPGDVHTVVWVGTKLLQWTFESFFFFSTNRAQIGPSLHRQYFSSVSWLSVSHTGLCDDRTWEPSLSHLRRSCLCSFVFFSPSSINHPTPVSGYRICRLFPCLILLLMIRGIFIFSCLLREEDQVCVWSFSICKECDINLLFIEKKKANMFVDSWFKELQPLALSVSRETKRVFVCKDACLHRQIFLLFFSKKISV